MAKTIVGLFDNVSAAQSVVQDLLDNGFTRDQISLVAQNSQLSIDDNNEISEEASDGAGAGAVGGTVLGGALGLLVGTGLLVIPGIGPVLAAGPLIAAIGSTAAAVGATALGAGVGAATGGLAGSLVGAGVSSDDADHYAEGVRRGGTLISVEAEDTMVDKAYQIMKNHDVVDLKDRSTTWSNSGSTTTPERAADQAGNDWEDSSKLGTGTGTISGAVTGAAIGSVGGPVGTVIGGIAGAVTGGGVGAAGDIAGENLEETDSARRPIANPNPTRSSSGSTTTAERAVDHAGNDWEDSSKIGTGAGTISGAATGAAIGSVGGPVGTVIGGIAGAVTGGGVGAAGDIAGEHAEETGSGQRSTAHAHDVAASTTTDRSDFARGQRDAPMSGANSDFARGQRSFETYDEGFRSHHQQYLGADRPYDYYSPAYRYGYDMAGTSTTDNQSWDVAEPELRRSWERDHPDTWSQFKQAVKHAWESARNTR